MRWFKRDLWKTGIASAGMLLFLILALWVYICAAHTAVEASGLGAPATLTVQMTPTEDATVTALNKEKLAQEVQQLKNQNAPDPYGWLRTNAAILISTLVVVIGGLIGLFRWFGDRRNEQEKRAEERFLTVVESLGSTNLTAQVGAAIMLRTFLRPGYEQFYCQVFDLAVVYLRLRHVDPETPDTLDPLSQTLIPVFMESFLRARDSLKQSPQFLDATSIQLDLALMKEADLQHIWMPEAYLRDANIRGINLHKAELRGTDFYDTSLHLADLSEANLRGASFHKARLYKVNFREATLTWAIFMDADLTDADFTDADLNGANFKGARVTPEQLGKAKSLEGIIMPNGSMPYGRCSEPDYTPEWYMKLQPQG